MNTRLRIKIIVKTIGINRGEILDIFVSHSSTFWNSKWVWKVAIGDVLATQFEIGPWHDPHTWFISLQNVRHTKKEIYNALVSDYGNVSD